ncbi:MAG: hypothetical protein FWD66_08470 [Paludibacter sp.]|nr:hypothetical protein [Paludibacter sp.]
MIFIDQILLHKSVSVVGMAKNTGKTETLNFILSSLQKQQKCVAVTSIGLDGEKIDQIFGTKKPEITIYQGMIFATVEKFFENRTFDAKILKIDNNKSVLGKIVLAQALQTGKVILSGAVDTQTLKRIIKENVKFGADITLVDGATSRLSLASPAVTDAMILATGAALSPDIESITRQTKFVVSLVGLPPAEKNLQKVLANPKKGLFCIDKNLQLIDLQIESVLIFDNIMNEKIFNIIKQNKMLFISGALNDKILNFIILNKLSDGFIFIVSDFTKLFISQQIYNIFTKKGGKICVLNNTNLLAITVNPTSPEGYSVNSEKLQITLRHQIDIPIFNVREI